jgi:uncharacterized protein (TIGR02598 family)
MNMRPNSPRRTSSGGAFSLIEVTLALGVATFCLVTISGLLPIGLTSNQASLEQTMAGNISSAILADLRSAQPLSAGITPRFGFSIPAAGATTTIYSAPQTIYLAANGSVTSVQSTPATSGSAISRYRATLGFTPPSNSGQRTATTVRVLITWPALADANPSQWPTNYTGSYEAETTLDRN